MSRIVSDNLFCNWVTPTFSIVQMQEGHLKQAVAVHMEAFPSFFVTFLGPNFLLEFYRFVLTDSVGRGFVAVDAATHEVLGVVVGSVVPDGFFKRLLKKRWWAFCLASVSAVAGNPKIVRRLFQAVFYRGEPLPGPRRSLLTAVAVAPLAQKRGIGEALLRAWTEEIKESGSTGCCLTTDADQNEAVNRFYVKCGWHLAAQKTTPEGRMMNHYVYDFEPEGGLCNAEPCL